MKRAAQQEALGAGRLLRAYFTSCLGPDDLPEVPCVREFRIADGAEEIAFSHEIALPALSAAPEDELVVEPAWMRHADPVDAATPGIRDRISCP